MASWPNAIVSVAVRQCLLWAALMALVACGGGANSSLGTTGPPPAAEVPCSDLAGRSVGGAELVSAIETSVGGTPSCVVDGQIDATINFQLTIPCDWNGKLLYLGSGGFGGSISPATGTLSPGMLGDANCDGQADGYAIVASDTGHQGATFDAEWVLSSPAAADDFAFRAVHVVQLAAREIIRANTGEGVNQAYFEGCSDGGREGLIAAQRYPDDFNGIVARAPAANWTGLMTTGNRIARRLIEDGAKPGMSKLNLLGNAQLDACDANDGLADGIISLPDSCTAVIDTLRCPGADEPSCLTDEEISTFQLVRSPTPLPFAQADGVQSYAGYSPGHEEQFASWPLWLVDGAPFAIPPIPPLKIESQNQFFRYFIAGDPDIDPLQINLADYAVALERESRRADATNANLDPFFKRGGKLILWHGNADPAISVNDTTAYYENAVAATELEVDDNIRYYTAPGVLHCRSGPGADTVDLVTPLANWVESGVAPGTLIARRYPPNPADGTPMLSAPPVISRPLCLYPQYPHYNGAGDAADATSFTCRSP